MIAGLIQYDSICATPVPCLRIFQIIDNIQIRKGLVLDLRKTLVEKEYLQNLPSVDHLEISSYHVTFISMTLEPFIKFLRFSG